MIKRDRPSVLRLLFVWRGSIVPHILPQIIGFAPYAVIIVAAADALGRDRLQMAVAPFAVAGITLSIYLSFRNSAAYDRWWEARRLWGQLVAESRNLPRATEALLPDPALRLFAAGFCCASSASVTCFAAACAASTCGAKRQPSVPRRTRSGRWAATLPRHDAPISWIPSVTA